MDALARRRRIARHTALAGAGLMLAVTTLSAFVRLANIGLDGAPETDAVLLARGAHRIAASTVLLVVLALLALSLGPRPYLQREGRHALALLLLTVFLAVLGRWSSGSPAPAVTLGNLLGGFLVFALFWRLALPEPRPLDARLQQFAGLAAAALLALLAVQLTLGLLQYTSGQPLGLVLAHNIVALLLLATLLRFVRLPLLGDGAR